MSDGTADSDEPGDSGAEPLVSLDRRTFLRGGVGVPLVAGVGAAVWTDSIVAQAERRFPPMGTFTSVDGGRVHHLVDGDGPPVVLVHGDGGSVYDWTFSAFDRVAAEFRAIAVDRPGFGYSDPPDRLGSPFRQARWIRAALDELQVTEPVVVGHSRGASVALAHALDFPEATAGVVTLAGAPFGHDPAPIHFRALTWPVLGQLLAETVFVPFSREVIASGIRAAFRPEGDPPPPYIDAYVAMERRPGQLRAHAFDSVRAPASYERLIPRYADIEVPVAVVHGTADQNVPVAQARQLQKGVPTARLTEVEHAGHELPFFHPGAIIGAVEWVLEECDGDRGTVNNVYG